MKHASNNDILEFLRYCLVGGIATLVDWAVLYFCTEWLFVRIGANAVYPSHALSFLCGLTVNFLLSNHFVFVRSEQRSRGRDLKSFLLFAVIGLIGLGITELGAWLADVLFNSRTAVFSVFGVTVYVYMIAKAVLTVIVLFWNYLARKYLVYDRKVRRGV